MEMDDGSAAASRHSSMIDRGTIDRIRDQTSIVGLIGESVQLQRRGRSHLGLCPFHQEKTPSFHVDEERGFYHCFGCGTSGDVFAFVQQNEGLSFTEAVFRLAERLGLAVERVEAEPQRRQEDEARRRRQLLYDAGSQIAAFFCSMLRAHPLGYCAVAELQRLGLVAIDSPGAVADAAQAFRVGYAPYGRNDLAQHLERSGISLQAAETLGVVARGQDGRGHVDCLRHCLVVAILDHQGRVVSFAGRALEHPGATTLGRAGIEPLAAAESGAADVGDVGCPDSPVYRKRSVLFGLHQARRGVRERDECVLVEGSFDVLVLHAHGITNVVAPLGSALTPEQAQGLKRLTPRATFLFAGDDTGRRAVAAARDACHQAGLLARVACLPEGLRPSRLLRRHGPEALRGVIGAARGMLEYLVDSTLDSRLALDDLSSQAARVHAVGRLLASEADPLVRAMAEQYADQVVARLGVAETRSFRQLAAAVQTAVARAEQEEIGEREGAAAPALTSRTAHRSERVGQEVLGALLDCPQLLGDEELTQQLHGIEGDAAAAIAAARRCWDGRQTIDTDGLLAKLGSRIRNFAQARLAAPRYHTAGEARAEIVRCARSLLRYGAWGSKR
jgi:DNA primase